MAKTPGDPAKARAAYDRLIGPLRERARELGYAIGVHGSLARDIDLIACPWTDDAVAAHELAEALRLVVETEMGAAFNLEDEGDDYFMAGRPGAKAHRRLSWVFHTVGTYVDLSVMPRVDEWQAIDLAAFGKTTPTKWRR